MALTRINNQALTNVTSAGLVNATGTVLQVKSKLILDSVVSEIQNIGYNIIYVKKSSLKGKKGNQEYFCYLKTKNDKKS